MSGTASDRHESSKPALRDNALAAFARRDTESAELLSAALNADQHDGRLLICEAEALAENGAADPLARLQSTLRKAPDWVAGHLALARLAIEFGGADPLADLRSALRTLGLHPGLWHAYLQVLAGQQRFAEAADQAQDLRGKVGDVPELRLLEARYAGLAGDPERGRQLLDGVSDGVVDYHYQCARNALQRGDVGEASRALDAAPETAENIRLWALREICWRANGDSRHTELLPDGQLTASFDLGLSASELTDICETLRALHTARAAPPSQSVRGGTQTRGALHQRGDAVLQALFSRFAAALAEYGRGFARYPLNFPPSHPLAKFSDTVPQITASWSVRLMQGGHHVPHLHDTGLISSACHLVVPGGVGPGEGALELGRPPSDVALDLEPFSVIQPQAGRLILFPSFLYHGTTPFTAGERLSAVIDAA